MPVPETTFAQCLVDYFEDGDGLFWHHRILLIRAGEKSWIWVAPDGEVQLGDLATHRIIPLQAGQELPQDRAHETYTFDPATSDADIQGWFQQARALASILGVDLTKVPGDSADRWFVTDVSCEAFGEEVPSSATANPALMVVRGDVALVKLDDVWVTAGRAAAGLSKEDWHRELRAGPGRDPRLAGDERDSMGRPFLGFSDLLERCAEPDRPGFPLKGKRAAREAMRSIRDAGQSGWDEHHMVWARRSGIAERCGPAREHRLICMALRLFGQYDQYECSASAGVEALVRRLLQIEAATRRNPRQPDFEGLDIVLDSASDEHGSLVVADYMDWVGQQQRNEATVLKAGRQWREEQAALHKRTKGGKKGADEEKQ